MADQPANMIVPPNVLFVEVRNPDTVLFQGSAIALSSKNSVGPFDVLPQHENFISLISSNITIYQDKKQKKEIQNTSAIIKAERNKVNIFIGVETLNPAVVAAAVATTTQTPIKPTPISKPL